MDVTPRTTAPEVGPDGAPVQRPPRTKGWVAAVVLVVVIGGVGFLLIKQIGTASLYYYNADEAVAKKTELADKRFRVQGTYVGRKQEVAGGDIRFTIAFNGSKILVDHSGSQPALFRPGTAVVLDGRWSPDGALFESDRIEVKHSENYEAEHPDRVTTTSTAPSKP